MIAGVIFDMDGVIFDTERLWKLAFEEANERYGLALDEAFRQTTCGKNEALIRRELRERFPSLDADRYRDDMLRYVISHSEAGDFEVKSGFLALMEQLKAKRIKTALATSSHRARALKLFALKQMETDQLFDAAVFSEDTDGRSKPDPYIFLTAAELIGLPPERCLVVEDSLNGIEAAYNGGFQPIMAVDLIPPNEYCRTHTKAVIHDLSELKTMMGEF